MNKSKLVISASIVALMLSLCLFAVSVFAAVNQGFGVNNKITFLGKSEYLIFNLNAEVTGTTKDGDPELSHTWNYNEETSLSEENWNIEQTLIFNDEEKNLSEVFILYTFEIVNNINSRKLRVYIDEPDIDLQALKYEIKGRSGTEIVIDKGMSDTVWLKLMPNNEKFTGERQCNISLHIEGVA